MNVNKYALTLIFALSIVYLPLSAFSSVIILLGPPGSGKGTFSQHLKENYDYTHISVGDVLRSEIEKESELGLNIKETVAKGDYVPSEIIHTLLENSIRRCQKEKKPFILDGFGQNQGEIERIYKLLKDVDLLSRTLVMYLEASNEVCIQRIANRSVCLNCGHVYNSISAIPSHNDKCAICGTKLSIKLNDTADVVIKRLIHYRITVEKYNHQAIYLFPSLIYCASGSLEKCLRFYDYFMGEIDNCPFDSTYFIKNFQPDCISVDFDPE